MPRKLSPLTIIEQAAVDNPISYEVVVFTRGDNGKRQEFDLDQLAQAQQCAKETPRSILYIVGANGYRVPYEQVNK